MPKATPFMRRKPLAIHFSTVLLLSSALTPVALAQAQSNDVRAVSQQVKNYNIAAGSLSQVLSQFAGAAGIAISFDAAAFSNRTSPGLQGNYSVEQGFATLLTGTGQIAVRQANGDYVLQSSGGAMVLGPIKVEGQTETGAGPVEGFRARNSVSATNVDAPLIETPATVNVLTRDFLDTIGSRQFEDAVAYLPGASVQAKGSPNLNKFNLRGFEVNTLSSGGVYVDGFTANRRGYHFDRSLYERVDILKGTSAVLFGVASPGGVVNYVRKKPQFESAYRIDAALGSFDLARTSLDATGAIGNSNTLAYRLVVTGNTGDQTTFGNVEGDGLEDDFIIFNPQLTWLTPGGGELNLSYEYNDMNRTNASRIYRLDSGEILFNRKNLSPDNSRDSEAHIGTLEFTQSLRQGWDLSLGAKIIRADNDDVFSGSFGPLDGSPRTRFDNKQVEKQRQEEYRAEINGEFFTGEQIKHQLTIGYSHLETETEADSASVFADVADIEVFNPVFGPQPLIPTPQPRFVYGTDPEMRFYLQDYVSIGDKLNVFGGVSYVDFTYKSGGINNLSAVGEDDGFVWNLGAIYNYSALLNPFISYATSLELQGGLLQGGSVVPSQEGKQFEIGNKSEWFDGRLATTLSLFQIEQTNKAERDPNDPTFTFSILAGDQRTRGFEFEAVGNITDQIRIFGGYSFLDAEFTKSTTGNKGNMPFAVPEHKFSLFGEYSFAGELQGWSTGLGFIHESDRKGNNANTFELPSYERVDLTFAYRRGPFDFRGSVENVLDKNYVAGVARGNADSLAQGAPRFFTLAVGYQF